VISDYRMSKVLVVNEIELGMLIPTIESRASKISRDEGNTYMGLIESWHRGSSDMIIDEYVGVNMGSRSRCRLLIEDHVYIFSNP
jgi:hypothetical protein